ncbi:hypothetical protein MMYC01_210386 [Madurella mycetomatis]|uniref:Uncharacterized protein n=1 Tax=Madurella mycetomatis TaxID=100816 RepID=A0A175VRA4_9PEZI|nr:hypothetical protein MMYC01_210281 [Madurella mycetomatis]KXX73701.1 hypothetical protein MMYC01_210386 [Madurella mycetomatis]
MSVCSEVKRLYASLQEMVGLRRRKGVKHSLQISEPFNFKKEITILPGFTEDEIAVLREKAAASRLAIADADAFTSANTRSAVLTPTRLSGPLPPLPFASSSSSAAGSGRTQFLTVPNLPIPILGSGSGDSSRRSSHNRSGSSSLKSSSTAATNLTTATARWPARVATHSMNDLLLLGGGAGGGAGGGGSAVAGVQHAIVPAGGGDAGPISPLDLGFGLDLDGMDMDMDMDMEFDLSLDMEFELGDCRVVSPLAPSVKGNGLVGKKGRVEV